MRVSTLLVPAFALMLATPSLAAEHEVRLLNRGTAGVMVFEPALVKAEPGDTVKFVITDKGHNVESIKGLLPAGVEPFSTRINEGYSLTVTEPGVYGVDCKPHYPMGMVALIVVGDGQANLEKARTVKLPGKAYERVGKLLQEAGL